MLCPKKLKTTKDLPYITSTRHKHKSCSAVWDSDKRNSIPLHGSHSNDILCSDVNSIYLWKETLHNDGQQFHQYQQNEQWLFISTRWKDQDI